MCFSQPMSAAFAAIMWTFAIIWKGPTGARSCVAYFAFMETLQAFQYGVINECDNPLNKIYTLLGFFHLAFQPFFVNLYLGTFMSAGQKKYLPMILSLSFFGGIMMCNRLWMTEGDHMCTIGIQPMCGAKTCTFRGNVHLAWQMPMQHADQDYFTPGWTLHFFLFYLPTYALGMYGHTIFLLLSGPFLGRAMTSHQDEIPAIWCFFSICQIFFPLIYAFWKDPAAFKLLSSTRSSKAIKMKGANGQIANGHSANGHSVANEKSLKTDDDPVGGTWGYIRRGIYLFIALTLKRYATLLMNPKAFPDGVPTPVHL